jgi:ketosteroid isomerase-like protein
MKRFPLLLILFLALAATGFAQSNSKDDAALTSLVKQLADAQVAFDLPALDRIFTSDYIEISPLGEFDPRDKVLGFYKPEMKPPGGVGMTLDVSEVSIRNYGKFAVVIAKLTYTPTGGQKAPPRSIRATFVCRREGKEWKIASAQYTGIRPPQPPKT